MPDRIVEDLGLGLTLLDRAVASYTPVSRAGGAAGLLVERDEGPATAASFRALTGSDRELAGWQRFYGRLATLAEDLAPTLTEPLLTSSGWPPGSATASCGSSCAAGRWPTLVADHLSRRRRPRRRPHRRADRHLRRRARRRRPGQPLLPLPPGRQRHGQLAGAGGRHGGGHRGDGRRRPAGRGGAAHRRHGHRGGRRAAVVTVHWTDDDGAEHAADAAWVVCGAAPAVLDELTGTDPGPRPVRLPAQGQHGARPAAAAALGRRPGGRLRRHAARRRVRRPTGRGVPAGRAPGRCRTSSRSRCTATR